MYFYVDTAKGKRINHYARDNSWCIGKPDNKKFKTINKGDKCLVFCNGTIGPGRISYNYAKCDAIKVLQNLINKLQTKGE